MADDRLGGVLSLTAATARWYLARFERLFARMTNQGLGAFVVFALSLAVAAVLLRVSFYVQKQDEVFFSRLMQTELQPQTEASRGAILSIVLQGLTDPDVAAGLYCGNTQVGDCAIGDKLVERTETLLAIASRMSADANQNIDQSELERLLPGVPGALDRLRSVSSMLLRAKSTNTFLGNAKCPESETPETTKRTRMFQLSAALCSDGPGMVSVQVVPEQVAGEIVNSEPCKSTNNNTPAKSNNPNDHCHADHNALPSDATQRTRVELARATGQLFDLAAHSIANEIPPVPSSEGPRLAAAYFISVDSVIQYWSRYPKASLADLPPYRLWAARPYFEDLLKNSAERSETRAYIDFTGKGIVHTLCKAVHSAVDVERVSGVICADYALADGRINRLISVINRFPMARAAVVAFSPSGGSSWSLKIPEIDRVGLERLRPWLEEFPHRWLTDHSSKREIEAAPYDKLTYFVPLGLRNDGLPQGMVLRIQGFGPAGSQPMLVLAAVLALGLSLLAYRAGVGSSKEVSRRERELGHLRSLPVAVVHTDGNNLVIGANDRAEELLGVALPAFGLNQSPRSFWDLFDKSKILFLTPEAVIELLSGDPNGSQGKHEVNDPRDSLRAWPADLTKLRPTMLVARSEQHIREERMRGNQSSYLVRVLPPARYRWLKVTAGPIFQPHGNRLSFFSSLSRRTGDSDLSGTFGILEEIAPDATREAVEKVLDAVPRLKEEK